MKGCGIGTRTLQTVGSSNVDLFLQDCFLINGVSIKIQLVRSKDAFAAPNKKGHIADDTSRVVSTVNKTSLSPRVESGSIDVAKMRTMLAVCCSVSVLGPTNNALDTITLSLFDDADKDDDGEISFDQFRDVLQAHTDILDNLAVSPAVWLRAVTAPLPRRSTSSCACAGRHFSEQQIGRTVFLLLYGVINVILFTIHAYKYRDTNAYLIIARGCGMCLNFNCAFIVVFVLRYCLTLMRSLRLSTYLPLDDNIYFHKVVGVVVVVQSVVHTLAHLANLYLYTSTTPTSATNVTSTATTPTYWECLFTTRCGIGWIPGFGFAYLSGVLLWVPLLVIVVFSLPWVRRGGHFHVFYWTHSMFVVFWILTILHGPIFWMFFVAPGTVYLLERIYRTRLFKLAKYGSIHITEMNLLPSKVTHLVIEKPENFHHQPGDYVYVNIPNITEYEWHPFTISSSPEMPDHLWLHVRSLGVWTSKLYNFCRKYKPLVCDHRIGNANHTKSDTQANEEKIDMHFNGYTKPQRREGITFAIYRRIKRFVKVSRVEGILSF
ncbi:NADPH oxidase 5 [Lamellibrachia satsuma]|nr:NADPH oxidase 5 [Lamellibrachia satsuma]